MKKKSMLQKLTASTNFTMADWLAMKPYGQPLNNYDISYVQLCQDILRELDVHQFWIKSYGVTREQFKQLTCQLVSYFEDYVNEIGIWQAYIETNESLYGYALPFYDLSDYDKENINVEDIAFLIWHFLSKYSEKEYITDPERDNIMDMAEAIFDHFDSALDDIPAIDFYDNFFTIKDNEDYFAFKTKMHWFSTKSYLLGLDFKGALQQSNEDMTSEAKKGGSNAEMLPIVMYSFLEKFMYQKRSSYSALNGPEWFAKIARCSEKRKQEIIDLTYWIDGKFFLKERQKEHFIFEHLLTKVTYKALANSFQKNHVLKPSDTDAFNMHLIRWNGVYWLSGMMFSTEMTPSSIKKYKREQLDTPWILPDETLGNMTKTTQSMYDAFVKFFGSPLAIFDNQAQLNKANMDYMDFYKQSLNVDIPNDYEENRKKFKEMMGKEGDDWFGDFGKNRKESIALFFIKDGGMYTCGAVKEVVHLLKAATLTKDQQASLFVDFANGYIPSVCNHLLSEYETKNIKYPTNESLDVIKYLPFFHRMNSPEEFDRQYPMLTMISTEDIDM